MRRDLMVGDSNPTESLAETLIRLGWRNARLVPLCPTCFAERATAPRRAPPEPSAEAIDAFIEACEKLSISEAQVTKGLNENYEHWTKVWHVRPQPETVAKLLRAAYAVDWVDRPAPTVPGGQMIESCGAAIALCKEIIVYCSLGDHQNCGYHEGPLGANWVRYNVRWSPIGGGGPTDVHLVPRKAIAAPLPAAPEGEM